EVDLPLRDGVVKLGVFAHQPGRLRTAISRVLAQSQFVHAVSVERRARAQTVNAAAFHLAEMSEQVGERDVRPSGQTLHGDEEVVIRKGRKSISLNHVA